MWVQSLGQEEGLETHSSSLAWRILWTEEPGGLQSIMSQRVWETMPRPHTLEPNTAPFSGHMAHELRMVYG